MHVSIDGAGRVVIPKPLRDQLGFSTDRPLEAEVVDGHLELSVPYEPARLVEGPHGPSIAATGTPIGDEDVRRTLETVRERR
jgi:bifunctional DNA-binding transcriptional regulator/antitoxin component of YhaV-PrlF toxin-antitoxin module